MARKKKPRSKMTAREKLIEDLDVVFSHYIRLKHSDRFGYCNCYTCGKHLFWKEIQNGHFWSRAKYSVRWDEINCRPQCVGCNIMRQGNHPEYSYRLLNEIGREEFDKLEQRKNEIHKVGTDWYEERVDKYKKEVKKFKKLKNLE